MAVSLHYKIGIYKTIGETEQWIGKNGTRRK